MISEQQRAAIAAKVESMKLCGGVGNEVSACSIAAINLALTGKLTDDIPDCMSPVIGQWIIGIQDTMPFYLRNSAGWKALLPLAAGTGRAHEEKRLALIMDWMWGTVLPAMQQAAESGGYGPAWSRMTQERTYDAAKAAGNAADAADAAEDTTNRAAWAAATWAAKAAATWAADAAAARVARAGAGAAACAADAAYRAAGAGAAACAADGGDAAWQVFDPVGLLERLINVGGKE